MNPKGLKKEEYDVAIIGAGIGGLVCGCYLAKAGMKVLIVEQHHQVGGYCQSFMRNGFIFEAGPHALGSLREEGQIGIIFRDLELGKRIKVIRKNPSDLLVTPDFKIPIKNNLKELIAEFQENFPHQAKEIKSFFEFIDKVDATSLKTLAPLYIKLRNKSFRNLLDSYFSDDKLKAVLTMPLSGLTLPATIASALTTSINYKEFVLDGGYYPIGGLQMFVGALAKLFKENGGEIILSQLVNKIVIKNNIAEGIRIKDALIKSRYVVSGCDVRQTFLDLIGKDSLKSHFIDKLSNLVSAGSGFSVYLGINKNLSDRAELYSTNLIFNDYNVDRFLDRAFKDGYKDDNFVLMVPSLYDDTLAPTNSEVIRLFVNASFSDNDYIEKNKNILVERLIKKLEKIIPDLSKYIVVTETATPFTLHRYTLNYNGSIRGWAALPSQHGLSVMPSRTPIRNLFLASHWVSDPGQGGVATVVFSGRNVARIIVTHR